MFCIKPCGVTCVSGYLFVLATVLASSGLVSTAAAYPRMVFEQEPNNAASQFHQISGEVHIIGEISSDDEDYFLWVLDEGDADKRWRFELIGEDGVSVQAQFLLPVELEPEPETVPPGTATLGVASFGSANADETVRATVDTVEAAEEAAAVLLTLNESESEWTPQSGQLVSAGEYLIRVTSQQTAGKYQLLLSEEGSQGTRVNLNADQDVNPVQADRN